nr:tetratricopeptide repeat protein [Candidatus Sigynarchaeota archaeon]
MNVPSIYFESTRLLNDLIDPAFKYTIIAGAGVSMDAPTCLLSARQIVGYLIDACCPVEEVQKLKSLDGLRYEVVIEAIEKHFDKDLNFMNFFDKFENPNLIHYFIARVLLDGIGDVITTNFDYLIEYALLALNKRENYARIFPVITRPDFTRFNDKDSINALKGEGKLPVCKVHGSKKNIITGEDTRHSLVTTMKDLGRDREGAGTFTVEPYKRPLLSNLTEGRVLLVMGYSGGDDFDIGPTLQDLVGVKSIVWINHANEIPAAGIPAREVRDDVTPSDIIGSVQQIDRVLGNLKLALREKGTDTRVFRVDAPTGKLIEGVAWPRLFPESILPNLSPPDEDAGRLDAIIKDLLGQAIASDVLKWEMAGSMYNTLSMHEDATRCFEKEVDLANAIGDHEREAEALRGLALIRGSKSLFDEALQFYERALPIAGIGLRSRIHEGMGNVHKNLGNFKESVKNFRLALKIANEVGDDEVILNASLALSSFYREQLKFTQSLDLLQDNMKRVDKTGDLSLKSVILSEMALIHSAQQD